MKVDKFIGILLILFVLFILTWITQPDFRTKNPALAELLGLTSSTVQKNNNINVSEPSGSVANSDYKKVTIKIVGASVSFDGSYSQVVVYVGKNYPKLNISNYILKTTNGSFVLPSLVVKGGDYLILTSNNSVDGSMVRRVSSNHYEINLSQRILSPGYETAELYSSAGVLVSKYSYGLSTLF